MTEKHEVVRYQKFRHLLGTDLQCSCGARFYLAPSRTAYRGTVERAAEHFKWDAPPPGVPNDVLESWVITQIPMKFIGH